MSRRHERRRERPRERPRPGPPDTQPVAPAEPVVHCVLCGRVIPQDARSSLHHLVPKARGGARGTTVRLHQICHSTIHSRYSETELARRLAEPENLRSDPELARFVSWIRTKPNGFHAPTRTARMRKDGR